MKQNRKHAISKDKKVLPDLCPGKLCRMVLSQCYSAARVAGSSSTSRKLEKHTL